MAGRPKIFDEADVLGKAVNLFWSKGYEATSTEDLLRVMKLNKGSLYHSFGSKKELFSRSLDFFHHQAVQKLNKKIGEVANPADGIYLFFMELASTDLDTHYKGCFMGNSIAETVNIDSELKEKAVNYLKRFEIVLSNHLEEAIKGGFLKSQLEAGVIAKVLLNIWNGINITRRMYPDKEILESILKNQLQILR